MTIDYINKFLTKFYLFFILYATVLLISWGVLFFNSDLLLVPITISSIMIYLSIKKIPEYSFWNKILRLYKNSELEEFIEKEHSKVRNIKEYKEKNKTTKTITASRLEHQYQTEKNIYMSGKKFNKVKILLELKKLVENDKGITKEIY